MFIITVLYNKVGTNSLQHVYKSLRKSFRIQHFHYGLEHLTVTLYEARFGKKYRGKIGFVSAGENQVNII